MSHLYGFTDNIGLGTCITLCPNGYGSIIGLIGLDPYQYIYPNLQGFKFVTLMFVYNIYAYILGMCLHGFIIVYPRTMNKNILILLS